MIKRTCNNCKALYYDQYSVICRLGYKIQNGHDKIGMPLPVKPMEECPKPLTNLEYCNLALEKSQSGQ